MSDENVRTVRENTEVFNRGDVELWLQAFDPEATFEPLRAAVQGAYRGHSGIREWLADTKENFEAFRLDITDIRDLGDDRVLSMGTLHVRGHGSGIETDVTTAAILEFRDGKIVRLKDYGDREKARQAAGLGE